MTKLFRRVFAKLIRQARMEMWVYTTLPIPSKIPQSSSWITTQDLLCTDKFFNRLLTSKQVLHPSQHRVLTVREQARAQGFPGTFTWDYGTQTPKDMYKQIGNAVAIPVGRALGRAPQSPHQEVGD
jgi:site-specific DNA-cytosine methylase